MNVRMFQAAGLALGLTMVSAAGASADEPTVLRHEVTTIEGTKTSLDAYRGQVLLIVNTASRCGLTPQYDALEKLYRAHKEAGLVVLGFPCNEFGGQEPGSEATIKQFCEDRYDVTFPLFAKVKVNPGEGQHPLYRDLVGGLTNRSTAGPIRWNFTKFLVGRDGKVAARFESRVAPSAKEVADAITRELAKPAPAPAAPTEPAAGEQGLRPVGPAGSPAGENVDDGATYRVARYFPVEAGASYVYDKTTRYLFRADKKETLTRRPTREANEQLDALRALRFDDSEGETMVLGLKDGAPAMGAQSMRAQGFEQTYDPPIVLFPAEAAIGQEKLYRSTVLHDNGRRVDKGAIERRVVLEAVEDVTVPAGTFAACLRFSAVTDNRPSVDGSFLAKLEETTWLAPGVGEVKSVQKVALSSFGITWLRATVVYELREPLAAPPRAPDSQSPGPQAF